MQSTISQMKSPTTGSVPGNAWAKGRSGLKLGLEVDVGQNVE